MDPGELDEGVAGEQRHVAVGDEHGAAQVGGQGQQPALDGPAGALDVVLVGDDQVGVEGGAQGDDPVTPVAHDHPDVLRAGGPGRPDGVADEA